MSPALQTLTHTSGARPSATASPSLHNSLGAGSPPFVLGFLALGLFAAVMLFVFSWRRFQMRGWTIRGISAAEVLNGTTIPMIMKRPKLWDLRNEGDPVWEQVASPYPGYGQLDGQWANIMPLSAKAVSTSELPNILHSRAANPSLPPTSGRNNLRRPRVPQGEPDLFDRLLPRAWRWRSSIHNKNTQSPPQSPLQSPLQPSTKLQVEVAIIMPTPQFPLYVKERTSNDRYAYNKQEKFRNRNAIPDFSIGLYECTWDES